VQKRGNAWSKSNTALAPGGSSAIFFGEGAAVRASVSFQHYLTPGDRRDGMIFHPLRSRYGLPLDDSRTVSNIVVKVPACRDVHRAVNTLRRSTAMDAPLELDAMNAFHDHRIVPKLQAKK
jgi:hypothetical protein